MVRLPFRPRLFPSRSRYREGGLVVSAFSGSKSPRESRKLTIKGAESMMVEAMLVGTSRSPSESQVILEELAGKAESLRKEDRGHIYGTLDRIRR